MTTFTDVFERKEVKYRLDARQHRAMAATLRGRMAPDAFGRTRIVSRYFDTPERALIERSLGHSLLIANTMVHVTAWGFVAAVRLPMLGA